MRIVGLLARAGRDRLLTRREQVSVVLVAHVGILSGVLLLRWAFQAGSSLPTEFLAGEILIIVTCGFLTVRIPGLQAYVGKAASTPDGGGTASGTDAEEGAKTTGGPTATKIEKAAGVVLIGAFIVQFVAFASLLWAAGGPIDSPFAEMTLAIAVFTPFLANKGETIGSVVVASIAYYAVLILAYSNSHPRPRTLAAYEKAYATTHPSVWAYFWVNVMILIGAITFSIYEALARSSQTGVGHAGSTGVPKDTDDHGRRTAGTGNEISADDCESPAGEGENGKPKRHVSSAEDVP